MNLLAVDTSTNQASVALAFRGSILSESKMGLRNHAQLMLPMIEALLSQANCTLSQLDGIVYGRGPGSFTGLRIACSIAKGLAYSHNLPLIPISTLSAIAHETWLQKKSELNSENLKEVSILSLLDARMNQVYWGYFPYKRDSYSEINPRRELRVEPKIELDLKIETEEFVTDASGVNCPLEHPIVLAGVNFENYLKELNPLLQKQVIQQCIIYPKAETMLKIALTGSVKPVSAAEASLVYIRNQITQRGQS